jgi:hypothetical protein
MQRQKPVTQMNKNVSYDGSELIDLSELLTEYRNLDLMTVMGPINDLGMFF